MARRSRILRTFTPTPEQPTRLDTTTLQEGLAQLLYSGARMGHLLTPAGVHPWVDLIAPRAAGDTPYGGSRAIAAEEIVTTAIAAVGGTHGQAMEILLQIAPGTSGLSLSERREMCADIFGISVETFVKTDKYEKGIMRILLMEIYRILAARGRMA
ncbi:hypothetical protein EDD29_6421 [Actinocorallia herbida]|uniref:Uncharacterized protein n=1 Tax=Actinocorallia herbida TaxID=58109 RepID=A0A3N1D5C7_9ACTN|nr:hypothetical protein [Actinocorallia herbida]ROO88742.1 hypothetical protein EDD29_6421 [Actinocorallia herbida]